MRNEVNSDDVIRVHIDTNLLGGESLITKT